MGIAVWRVTINQKMKHFWAMSVFAAKNMCDYQRSLEHVVTRRGSTGRSTVPYWCTIDVRTHTGSSGVPTGPPGPRRDPTEPRRHRRTPLHRSLPGLGGPQLLLASAEATCRDSSEKHSKTCEVILSSSMNAKILLMAKQPNCKLD